MSSEGKLEVGRRRFFRTLGVGAAAVAAAPLVTTGSAVAADNSDTRKKARYQPNSPDIKDYYRVNRYPKKS